MELESYVIIVAVLFVVFMYTAIQAKKNYEKSMKKTIKNNWGKLSDRIYEEQDLKKISEYYRQYAENEDSLSSVIDDITWNDLDLDRLFQKINMTYSSSGEEYLYKMLRVPAKDEDTLKHIDAIADYFKENEEDRERVQEIFYKLGRTKKVALTTFIRQLYKRKEEKNLVHYIQMICFFLAISVLFINPAIGIVALVAVICINMYTYYRKKHELDGNSVSTGYILRMINTAGELKKTDISVLETEFKELENIGKNLAPIKKGAFLVTSKNVSGSLSDVVMEYVKMFTHIDIIKFNRVVKTIREKKEDIDKMFSILGKIESGIAIASFREYCEYYAKPEFSDGTKFRFTDIYHPLIENPVANSMEEDGCVLLTGSNASGKSTFLKTVAINQILAQTIYTCTASEYSSGFYDVYSSMALRDNLETQESYYMVEIKSLKRILDSIMSGNRVMCFVDEILRGTNTIERIAASSEILKNMSDLGALCFAATHDIELTHILEDCYANYHFQEEVKNDDVLFNFILYKGRATSRNAIKLLKMIGYDENIVKNAENKASDFMKNGAWN